ncbi:hypothetical protein, partial [Methylomonas koyamae]|uniref:hypothetical protein n=1 Tax=Methylomonas koyamae TaxID=702114 RepID=UPI001E6473C6
VFVAKVSRLSVREPTYKTTVAPATHNPHHRVGTKSCAHPTLEGLTKAKKPKIKPQPYADA